MLPLAQSPATLTQGSTAPELFQPLVTDQGGQAGQWQSLLLFACRQLNRVNGRRQWLTGRPGLDQFELAELLDGLISQGTRHQFLQFRQDPFRCCLRQLLPVPSHPASGHRIEAEGDLSHQPQAPQQPQRVVGEV